MPPKHDLSLSGIEEFVNEPIVSEPTVKKPVVETSEAKASADKPKVVRKNNGAPIIEDWVSLILRKKMCLRLRKRRKQLIYFAKIKFVKSKEQVKSPRKTIVKQGNQNRLNTHSPRGNQRNWNNMMSQRLGSNFEMFNKACYACGSFDRLQYNYDNHQRQFNNKKMVKPVWNYTQRVNHQNFSKMTHFSPKRNMVPKAVLMRSGLVSLTTARPFNTAQPKTIVNITRPMTNVFNKVHSTVRRPINNKTTTKNSNFNKRVNNVSGMNVNTARPKAVVNAARPKAVLNAIKGNQADEGLFVGYSINSKAFRLFNSRTRIVKENLHVQFSENTPNIAGSGPNWLFDIDALTKSMNYKPVVIENQSNGNAGTKACDESGTKACDDASKARMEIVPGKDYILLPLWTANLPFSQNSKSSPNVGFKPLGNNEKKVTKELGKEGEVNIVDLKTSIELPNDPNMHELEDIVYLDDDEDVGAEADMNNLDAVMPVSRIPTTRIHKDHPVEQIIGD
ncbi:hypothetical protein Tco_0911099 [Tanacetum coccineum]|uniref:Retroviral polymerase SH3-like domain-containing protein n=1 Tax=Tanacetum coccineum TaxID=301880 RepID=A0ABQ5D113_9ASTR